jgi:hypothetical protein
MVGRGRLGVHFGSEKNRPSWASQPYRATLNASASRPVKTRPKVRALGGRIRRVRGSCRPQRTASVAWQQPTAHSAIAVGESCPAAVNAQTAKASTYSPADASGP